MSNVRTNVHFQRGSLLYEQGRYADAVGELRLQLGQEAEDSLTHGLLALCLAEQEQYDAATEHAQRAIHLAPDEAFGHYTLAQVMLRRNRFPEAQQAIVEAIRLNPYEADYFAILASLHLRGSRPNEALEAANRGLAIEPEHTLSTNLRAQALVRLGDRSGAAATMGQALGRRPDDAYTHANQGWTLLHQQQPDKALVHFREALRLDPGMEWARAGIVEAMKARNFVYRWMLAYFLWMARLSPQVRWILVIGALFGSQVIGRMAAQNPPLAPYLHALLYAYFAFVLMSWLSPSLFNLLLRFSQFGRYALSPDQMRGANVLAACVMATLLCLAAAIWTGNELLFYCTLMFALLSLPASAIYVCDSGWPRQVMALTTGALLLAVLFLVGVSLTPVRAFPTTLLPLAKAVYQYLPYAMLASQFAANYLAGVTPRK
ncbi:MAG: tetratricopeptide repeat protein [Pirellulaceae bacterium]